MQEYRKDIFTKRKCRNSRKVRNSLLKVISLQHFCLCFSSIKKKVSLLLLYSYWIDGFFFFNFHVYSFPWSLNWKKIFSKPLWYNLLYSVIVKTEDLFLQWTKMFLTLLLIARVSHRLHSYGNVLEAHWSVIEHILELSVLKILTKACICDLRVQNIYFASSPFFKQVSYRFSVAFNSLRRHGLSVRFSQEEYWSGLPFPPPGDLPDPGSEPISLVSPALDGRLFNTEPAGKPFLSKGWCFNYCPCHSLLYLNTRSQ